MQTQPVVVWITSGFPYGRGEQFIEAELPRWVDFSGSLTLLPENSQGAPSRFVPGVVAVDTRLMNSWHRRGSQVFAVLKTVVSSWFWREVWFLIRDRKVSFYSLKHALFTGVRMCMEVRALKRKYREFGRPIDVVYSYWMSVSAWAGCLAKRRGIVRVVVSRAHSSEFYEVARPEHYNAYVRQFAPEVDALALISEHALSQAREYGFEDEQLSVFRLGVESASPVASSPPDELSLISVSTMTPFKQLHLMIAAIRKVALALPAVRITWRHLGDGPLRERLVAQAEEEFSELPNLDYSFLGHVPNSDLLRLYQTHPVDLFLNSSSQEGVPVSIMEAMARSIPAIAPDVGAVGEVVLPELLISQEDLVDQLVEKILSYRTRAKDASLRERARDYATSRYSAESNYREFVKFIEFVGKSGI